MKLTVTKRPGLKKSETLQVRRAGNIPAVLYAPGKTGEAMVVDGTEFGAAMRQIKPGQLPTTVFTLMVDKKEKRAILKDIQYQLTSYRVSHLDFEELSEGTKVKVKVPITIVGAADCAGIKLGGFLRQVIRFVEVECLPKHIPSEFVVDVRDLGVGQFKRLSEMTIPATVKPLAKMDEVVVVIAKR